MARKAIGTRPAEGDYVRYGPRPMRLHLLKLTGLVVTWLVWSGVPDWDGKHVPLTMVFGALSVAIVFAIGRRMETRNLGDPPVAFWFRQAVYGPWLLKEIVLANLHVTRVILSRDPPIQPQLLRLTSTQRTAVGRTVYANSITLTPGTITLDLEGSELLVHALTREAADALREGEMDRRVTALERGRS